MARKKRTVEDVYDDLTGTQVVEAELIQFSVRGVDYEIDLAPENVKTFDGGLAPFIKAARVVRSKKVTASSKKTARPRSEEARLIRTWAREQGHEVSARGRIDETIVAGYHKAKGSSTNSAATSTSPSDAAS